MTENWDRYHPWGRCKVYAAFPWFRDDLWRLSKRCGNRVTDQPSLGHHNIWRVPQLRATLTRGEGIYRTPLLQRCEKLRIIPKRRTATELLHNFTRSKGSNSHPCTRVTVIWAIKDGTSVWNMCISLPFTSVDPTPRASYHSMIWFIWAFAMFACGAPKFLAKAYLSHPCSFETFFD